MPRSEPTKAPAMAPVSHQTIRQMPGAGPQSHTTHNHAVQNPPVYNNVVRSRGAPSAQTASEFGIDPKMILSVTDRKVEDAQ